MRFFYSAASLVLACGLAASPSALAAHRHSATSHYRVRHGDTLSAIASRFGVTVDQLRGWNHLRGSSIRAGHTLLVAAGHHATTQSSRQNTETASHYRVRRGDTLSDIAGHFGVTVDQLRQWNHLRGSSIDAGHTLRIAEHHEAPHATTQSSSQNTETASLYRVRRGDTLSDIASHFGVTVHQLRSWNHMRGSEIRTGHTLRVASHPADTRVAASRHSSPPHGRPEAESRNLAETIPPIPMRNGRLYVPPPLLGSHASLLRQNKRGKAEGLKRIKNVAQIKALRSDGKLVPLPVSRALRVDRDLPAARRCTRPWTAKFLVNLAHAHYVRFDRPLQINSAVRTVRFQRRLIRVNANAAPASGDIASPHLMGATIDIAKKGLSLSEVAWMRAYLLPLEQDGKIDVEEEFYQSCFHITVYKSYLPKTRKTRRRTPTTLLATGVR